MRLDKRLAVLGVAVLSLLATLAVAAPVPASAAGPEWRLDSQMNTSAAPGDLTWLSLTATNIGDAPTDPGEPIVLTVALPEGMSVTDPTDPVTSKRTLFNGQVLSWGPGSVHPCTAMDGSPLSGGEAGARCEFSESQPPEEIAISSFGSLFNLAIDVAPDASGLLTIRSEVSGGGAPGVSTVDPTEITTEPHFGIAAFDAKLAGRSGELFTQAGGHPHDYSTYIDFHSYTNPIPAFGERYPVEPSKTVLVDLPPGMVGSPSVLGECTAGELGNSPQATDVRPLCPISSQVGTIELRFNAGARLFVPTSTGRLSLYNMVPPVGVPARFGFNILGTMIFLDAKLRGDGSYGLTVGPSDSPQALAINGATPVFWGVPSDSSHDSQRSCPGAFSEERCKAASAPVPFLRLPTSCTGPEEVTMQMDSWVNPGTLGEDGLPDLRDEAWDTASFVTHKAPGFPADPDDPSTPWGEAQGLTGCDTVPVKGRVSTQPTSQSAETPSGLNVRIEIPNPGLENPVGIASSDIKKTVVALPEGVTINPSQGEGLGVCTPAQFESTELSFHPDPSRGCPGTAKIGTLEVHSPLIRETLVGSVFVAKPFDNPFDSLVALYFVMENPERGILVKLAGKVEPNEKTGQLVTTVDNIPQIPFESFELKFREGVRSPLATPRECGTYKTRAEFTPWSNPSKTLTSESTFEITRGVGGGPCPTGSAPFDPQLSSGTINNNALSYSPFNLRMIREDGEQEITRFSADLPPGVAAKLAGVSRCSEADLRATAASSGFSAIEGSICPANSQVGRVTAGYGVGSVQTRATGKVFLAGPYQGAPVSIATVIPAVVGPFDLGTVVQRSAFTVDPETAEVHVDSRASDPIPHILKGVELHLRDIRVYMDRPGFTFNPTSCDKTKVGAFLDGSGTNFFSPMDDPRVDVSNPFQVANCSLLPFKPKLSFKLKGGTKRGDFPALRATLKGRPGHANLSKVIVALPKSQFLEQSHIGTVCTRVQFADDNCPAASIYGSARATTPLLDKPLSGPVYLRSSSNQLPDLVIALRGEIAVNAVGRIDSVNGGIRSTFDTIPDTPIDTFTLRMQGGRKGLLVNSRNLCARPARANVRLTGQNGKVRQLRPKMGTDCRKARKKTPKQR